MKLLANIILLIFPFYLFAQQNVQKGDIYYDFFQYKEAIKEYEDALKNNRTQKNELHILTRLAYSYAYTFQYEKSAEKFDELIKLNNKKTSADAYLEYGNILKILGRYEDAKKQFNFYKENINKEDPYLLFVNKSLAWAQKHQDSVRTRTYVALTNLDIAGQSLGYAFFNGGLLYAKAKDTLYKESTTLFDLAYVNIKDSVTFEPAEEDYVDEIKFPFNEGSPSVNADGDVLYFTATGIRVTKGEVKRVGTTQISEDGVSNLKIYSAQFHNGKFTYIKELPFGNKEYNCTHPFITADGNTLYFASDMPGGYGGLDIYKSTKQANGTWSNPINMGDKINTTEHDMYPYEADGYLYFSSKGHVGFGGYDLFQSTLNRGIPSPARNMGKPFNSTKDDVAFIINKDGMTGYFSSNRDNSMGYDRVYYFNDRVDVKIPPSAPIAAVPSTIPEKTAPTTTVPPSDKPVVAANQPSVGAVKNNEPKPVSADLEEGKVLNTVKFLFNSSSLTPEFTTALNATIALVKSNKAIKLVIYAHTDCRGSDAYNLGLSQRRAQAVKNYLISKGIPAASIVIKAYGERQPVYTCASCEECTPQQHAANRRVEVKVTYK